MCNVINRNIFYNLKKILSSIKVIKLNELFLKFLPVLYFNQKNILLYQITNVTKIISFIEKGSKHDLLKSNQFMFVLKVCLLWIDEMKLKKRFLKFK